MKKIIIAGSSGFVGRALITFLKEKDYVVKRLVRTAQSTDLNTYWWDPESEKCNPKIFEDVDIVINLCGVNIFKPWTAAHKIKILESRIKSTHTISHAIARCQNPPKVFLNASAMGVYGDQGDTVVTEGSPPGNGFLAEVCTEWESAAKPAQQSGTRVVFLRTPIILDKHGGALERMLLPFKLGLGGVLGSGQQYLSWITLEDYLQAIEHILLTQALEGPVNMGTPYPVTNREFTKTLGHVLHRPTIFHVPEWVIKTFLGDMGKELLLTSTRMIPQRLIETGFAFRYPQLEEALQKLTVASAPM